MNNELPISPQLRQKKRPKLVWVITIFYLISVGWTLLSFALIYSGFIPVNEAQAVYFRSQNTIDMLFTIVIGLLNFGGALLLFLLRRKAFHLFLFPFLLGLLMTVYQIIFKNWLAAIAGPGLIGPVIGWGISIAVIIYARKHAKAGTLKYGLTSRCSQSAGKRPLAELLVGKHINELKMIIRGLTWTSSFALE